MKDYPTGTKERSLLRADIMEMAAEKARQQALDWRTTITCKEKPREEHGTCVGAKECLCTCHDGEDEV